MRCATVTNVLYAVLPLTLPSPPSDGGEGRVRGPARRGAVSAISRHGDLDEFDNLNCRVPHERRAVAGVRRSGADAELPGRPGREAHVLAVRADVLPPGRRPHRR